MSPEFDRFSRKRPAKPLPETAPSPAICNNACKKATYIKKIVLLSYKEMRIVLQPEHEYQFAVLRVDSTQ